MFSSSDEVYDVSISWNYIPLSVTDNFSVGKWTKIERNNGKLLCVKTLNPKQFTGWLKSIHMITVSQ